MASARARTVARPCRARHGPERRTRVRMLARGSSPDAGPGGRAVGVRACRLVGRRSWATSRVPRRCPGTGANRSRPVAAARLVPLEMLDAALHAEQLAGGEAAFAARVPRRPVAGAA
jgi:hypothetical protein